jgi:uncharacterized protein (TIGR02996 family)
MSDQRALLAAICAHPDEDTPRLAYADWLDEHAGAMPRAKRESVRMRAELIRVQCELARMSPDEEDTDTATRRVEREQREAELLKNTARRRAWAKPLKAPPAGHEEFVPNTDWFVRGFPKFADNRDSNHNGFLTVGEALFDISPVHVIDCRNIHGEQADQFLALPWLPRVRRLSISTHLDRSGWIESDTGARGWRVASDGTDEAATEKLFAAPGLANVEELDLGGWEFRTPGSPIVSRELRKLRKLCLSGGTMRGPDAFVRLGELLPAELRLREFELRSCRYGPEELRALVALPQLQRLERLTLWSRYGAVSPTPPLGAEGIHAITSAPFWPHLRALRMGHTTADFETLAAAPATPNLRTLELPHNPAGTEWVTALVGSPLLASVTAFDLTGASVGDEIATLLAKSPHTGHLLSLTLNHCGIGPKGVKALAAAPFAANLVRLGLLQSTLNKAGVDAILTPGAFPRLRVIDGRASIRLRTQQHRLKERFGAGAIV